MVKVAPLVAICALPCHCVTSVEPCAIASVARNSKETASIHSRLVLIWFPRRLLMLGVQLCGCGDQRVGTPPSDSNRLSLEYLETLRSPTQLLDAGATTTSRSDADHATNLLESGPPRQS